MIRDVFVLRPNPGQAVVELTGEHDLAASDDIDSLFRSLVEENELVVIDLSEAQFIDSSVLRSLVRADRAARERGAHVRLQLGTAPVVRRALEVSGLLSHLDCAPNRERALKPV